jgi:hypothetical protein
MAERSDDTDIIEDPEFEQKWFRFERLSWVLLTALLIAACLGLLGPGRLSTRRVETDSAGFQVEYPALVRARTTNEIRVRLNAPESAGGKFSLLVSGERTGRAPVTQSTPGASGQEPLAHATRYQYTVPPGASAEIVFTQRPQGLGPAWTRIALDGGAHVDLNQFVLP